MKHNLRKLLAQLAANPVELLKHAPNACRAVVGTLREMRTGGKPLTPELRDELLAKAVAGEHVELEVDLLAYEQKAGERNRNFVRFRDGALMAIGRSGKGSPFLRDHNQGDSLSKGGYIVASDTTKRSDGDYGIQQTARLTAPWAVEMALRGLMDRVSIGWRPTGPVMCSACNAPILSRCWHFPGDRLVEKPDENGGTRRVRDANGPITVEWIYTAAELVETSAVNIPGVPGAGIEDVRASMASSLSATSPVLGAALAREGFEPSEETDMDPELLKLLGLADTATADEVIAAVNKLRATGVADKAALEIVQKDLAKHQQSIAALEADRRKRDEDTFVGDALASGRIAKGDEEQWRALYQADAKRAGELMAKREPSSATPVGAPRQSGGEDPDRKPAPIITGGNVHSRNRKSSMLKTLEKVQAQLAANPRAAAFAMHAFGYEDRDRRLVGPAPTLGATGIANNADLDAARVGFHAAFLEQLTVEDDQALSQLFTEVPSNRKVEEWDWMGDLPDMEEWTSDRKLASLEGFKMRLANKKWANGLRIKNDDLKDDALGLIPPQIADLADRARFHRWDLMIKLLVNGFDGTAFPGVGDGLSYDDAFFFSANHRGGNDNKLTTALDSNALVSAQLKLRLMKTYDGKLPFRSKGTHLIVGPKLEYTAEQLLTQEYLANGESNTNRGKYTLMVSDLLVDDFDDYWFLADLRRPIRPFLFQMREEISASAIMGNQGGQNDSIPRFMNDEMWFGAEARYNVGYFEFRRIVGSKV